MSVVKYNIYKRYFSGKLWMFYSSEKKVMKNNKIFSIFSLNVNGREENILQVYATGYKESYFFVCCCVKHLELAYEKIFAVVFFYDLSYCV